jgi:NAD(P)-dependent dehydrogenase (short-subunit alcohol dehydrogenase family)
VTGLVIGGSAGLGRCVAERLARAGLPVIVASTDHRDAGAVAADLSLRYGVATGAITIDLAESCDFNALDAAIARLGSVNVVVFAAGDVSDGDLFPVESALAERLTRVNFLAIALYIDHLRPKLERGSTIVGIGSIAAFRGRRRNVVYSASKRALASLFESLSADVPNDVRVHFYHVGYLDTNMSFGRTLPLAAASADELAARIVRNRFKPSGVFFYPRYWFLIRPVLKMVPRAAWRRMRP